MSIGEAEVDDEVLETPVDETLDTEVVETEGVDTDTETVDTTESTETETAPEAWTPPTREEVEALRQQTAQAAQWQSLYLQEQQERRAEVQRQQQEAQQRQWMVQQQQQLAAQQAAAQFKWEAPAWNPEFNKYLDVDAAGNVIARPGADPRLPQQYAEFQKFQQDFAHKLVTAPHEALAPVLEHQKRSIVAEMNQQFGQMLAQRDAQQAQQNAALGFLQANRAWIIDRDAQGNEVINPQSGQPMFSPLGEQVNQTIQTLQQRGIPFQEAAEIARSLVERDVLRDTMRQQTAQTTAVSQNATQKNALLRGAVRQPARTGGQKKVGQKQPVPNLTGKQLLDHLFDQSGVNDLPPEDFADPS